MAAALAASLALAGAMYRWFEKPVLRIRDRLAAPVFIERTPASDPSGSEGERS
jgi:peptidoglycan/LPS O-acetylase OafA/YrhL